MNFESVCKVHFCETDFWTLVMQNWHNGQGAKELQAIVKDRGREDKSPVVDSRKKSRVVGDVILIIQSTYYPIFAVK